jgi:hypothetical protein
VEVPSFQQVLDVGVIVVCWGSCSRCWALGC